MMIEVLKSKIHCARVTEANLNYMGSITIDEDLLDAANMIAGEKVYIADNNNGERFETYIIKGERGSGKICLNGAAARKVQPDDIVIIMSYALMDFEEAKSFKPTVIFPDPVTNSVVKWESRTSLLRYIKNPVYMVVSGIFLLDHSDGMGLLL